MAGKPENLDYFNVNFIDKIRRIIIFYISGFRRPVWPIARANSWYFACAYRATSRPGWD